MLEAKDGALELGVLEALPIGRTLPAAPTLSVAMIGNFPPRRCGIATFTKDLHQALRGADARLGSQVVAMSDGEQRYSYPGDVSFDIRQGDLADYVEAAHRLNESGADVVCLQHEYGIFGGEAGRHLLTLLDHLRLPLVTTLHTVLAEPTDAQRDVMKRIIARSSRVVVMAQKARALLEAVYDAPARKICVIPHGAPDHPLAETEPFKKDLGLDGREVLLTFGLLSKGKGIEVMIRALPEIVAARPDALYVVLGATHPHVLAHEGERYREELMAMADELGVARNIKFVNAFVDTDMLLAYLSAADVYVTPYLSEAQITSGTLAYAVALGKPIISTPYWHAQEALADDRGILVPFGDSKAMADAAVLLLQDDARRDEIRSNAYAAGRATTWSRCADAYLRTFGIARAEKRAAPAASAKERVPLPALRLTTIERFTDACGIIQHGVLAVPDRRHGYCIDDNARALMLMQRIGAAGLAREEALRLTYTYAAFVQHAWNPDLGRFRNFMAYDRQWLEDEGSPDSFGRAINALGVTAEIGLEEPVRHWARTLLDQALPHVGGIYPHLRMHAFIALGAAAFVRARPHRVAHGQLEASANLLLSAYRKNARAGWQWFEPSLSYDNARLPEALIESGVALNLPDMTRVGLEALEWLCGQQTGHAGVFRAVGNRSFGKPHAKPAMFDQQPLEAAASVDACAAAFAASGDKAWLREAQRAFGWYLGENDLGLPVGDVLRGACHDGITPNGVNQNRGAESILSLQAAIAAMHVLHKRARVEKPRENGALVRH